MTRKQPLNSKIYHLKFSKSTPSLQSLTNESEDDPDHIHTYQSDIQSEDELETHPQDRLFEYEDIIYPKHNLKYNYKLTDILARESDVTISSQIQSSKYEYKGYGIYLIVTISHTIWLLWTFLPQWFLNHLGIYYYPSRWWSLSISSFVLMGMLYVYLALLFWNIEYESIPLDDLRTITDSDACVEPDIETFGFKDTNGVFDLRITDVNNVLYGTTGRN
ncbi:hypothetical protein WICPIJ_007919 [Wickerhamomyces pijperi]|uniref:PIG-P domain-containing protein n=1 Tax=Wickerhamomyces pijperi TaxID=599730 RepID=A0A9P8Q1H6_WICPI|nr:hypothetical protein WICPIJ_007919 [Wickerhamomyces pijperi]